MQTRERGPSPISPPPIDPAAPGVVPAPPAPPAPTFWVPFARLGRGRAGRVLAIVRNQTALGLLLVLVLAGGALSDVFLTPKNLLNILWAWQSRRGSEPSSVMKMALGCFLAGAAYVIMILAAQGTGQEERRSVLWLLGTSFILTLGELYLSPIGLSLVTKAAPARIVSMMMGVWFLSSFFGNYLSGYLGTFWMKMPRENFFLLMFSLSFVTGLSFFALLAPLKKAIGQDK